MTNKKVEAEIRKLLFIGYFIGVFSVGIGYVVFKII